MKDALIRAALMQDTLGRRRFLELAGAGIGAGTALLTGSAPGWAQEAGTALNSWYFAQEPNNTVLHEVLAAYTQKTGVPVEASGVAFKSYLDQTILAARSRRLSGVLHLDFNWLPALSELGVLRPLDDVLPTLGYSEAGQKIATLDGRALGLPVTVATISMVGNSQLLEEAGVGAVPKTTDEFVAALDRLKTLRPDMIPYALSTVPSESVDYLVWMWQFGAEVIRGTEVTLGDDASVAALEWLKGLYDAGYMAPSVTRADARAMFAQERTAFYEDAIVARSNAVAVSKNPEFGARVVPVPRPGLKAGDRPRASLWGNVMTVIDDDGADAAIALAKYLTADDGTSLALFKGIGLPPSTMSGQAIPDIAADAYTTAWTTQVTAFADIKPFAQFPEVLRFEGMVGDAVQQVLLGAMPAREALEACAAEIREVIG